jgi:hypothetical protein
MGVKGLPIIASAFPTNPSLNGESGRNSEIEIIRDAVSTMGIKNLFID